MKNTNDGIYKRFIIPEKNNIKHVITISSNEQRMVWISSHGTDTQIELMIEVYSIWNFRDVVI